MKQTKEQRIEAHTKVSMDAFDKGVLIGKAQALKQVLEIIDKRLDELYNNCDDYRLKNSCDRCDLIRWELEKLKAELEKIK